MFESNGSILLALLGAVVRSNESRGLGYLSGGERKIGRDTACTGCFAILESHLPVSCKLSSLGIECVVLCVKPCCRWLNSYRAQIERQSARPSFASIHALLPFFLWRSPPQRGERSAR